MPQVPGAAPDDPTPDFGALYRLSDDGFGLTPRLAYYLWSTALLLWDMWRLETDDREDYVSELPPIAQRVADAAWLERFTECFESLAGRLAAGEGDPDLATCTGEEMALHLVINWAESLSRDGMLDDDPAAEVPAAQGAQDFDFNLAREVLFRDHDVLALFDPNLDGIEDPDDPVNRQHTLVNLHPREWFIPFGVSGETEL